MSLSRFHPSQHCSAQVLEKLLPAFAIAGGRRLARSDSRGRGCTAELMGGDSGQPVSPRAGAVPLSALTYLIEAADEHRAQWGWCRWVDHLSLGFSAVVAECTNLNGNGYELVIL